VLTAMLLALGCGCAPDTGAARTGSPATSSAAASDEARALGVLRAWDRRRATAWAQGSTRALGRLYVGDAGRQDVRRLADYTARGLVVREMSVQVLDVRVLASGTDRLRVAFTDRLARAVAARRDGTVVGPLPRGGAVRHVVVLVRDGGTWRVATVSR